MEGNKRLREQLRARRKEEREEIPKNVLSKQEKELEKTAREIEELRVKAEEEFNAKAKRIEDNYNSAFSKFK